MEIENKLLEILVELDYDKITSKEAQKQILLLFAVINWVAFDFYKLETRPPKYGKYLITRKDGKIHWETWNGSGWAYNHNEIRYWAEIKPPCL
jgi:hypothetical protein